MVLSIVGVREFLLHRVDALDLSSCSFPAISDQRSAISVLLQSGRRRRPQAVTPPWWPWRRQNSFEAFWGEGNLQASLGMHVPKPMKSKTSSRIWVSPKNSGILASAMTQSGVLGKR